MSELFVCVETCISLGCICTNVNTQIHCYTNESLESWSAGFVLIRCLWHHISALDMLLGLLFKHAGLMLEKKNFNPNPKGKATPRVALFKSCVWESRIALAHVSRCLQLMGKNCLRRVLLELSTFAKTSWQ